MSRQVPSKVDPATNVKSRLHTFTKADLIKLVPQKFPFVAHQLPENVHTHSKRSIINILVVELLKMRASIDQMILQLDMLYIQNYSKRRVWQIFKLTNVQEDFDADVLSRQEAFMNCLKMNLSRSKFQCNFTTRVCGVLYNFKHYSPDARRKNVLSSFFCCIFLNCLTSCTVVSSYQFLHLYKRKHLQLMEKKIGISWQVVASSFLLGRLPDFLPHCTCLTQNEKKRSSSFQALCLTFGTTKLKHPRLSSRNVGTILRLALQKEGCKFEGGPMPTIIQMHHKPITEEPLVEVPNVIEEDSKNASRTTKYINNLYGKFQQPPLESLVVRMKSQFNGNEEIGLVKSQLVFSGNNVLEGIRELVQENVIERPLHYSFEKLPQLGCSRLYLTEQ